METKTVHPNDAEITRFVEQFINQTKRSVFLTGKAGTGKTTLLRKIVATTHKKTVVVAPTGIAALNAGGVTIHSFFQLPFGAFIPDFQTKQHSEYVKFETKSTLRRHFRMNADRLRMIRSLELIIIDEVSMLRADLLDAIDWTLRNIRNDNSPFGGVQVLFIGDLFQLPPVVKNEEWHVLRNYYQGIYFFNAQVLREEEPIQIELEKVYRQRNEVFLGLLNRIRENQSTAEDIRMLNQRVHRDFKPGPSEEYITLTTHNAEADRINRQELEKISGRAYSYEAVLTGDFPEHLYPIDPCLQLKVGAQVMFIKNDPSFEKNYYNGKIGKVISLDQEEIKVYLADEKKTILVDRHEWNNVRFEQNKETGEISEKVLGTFVHFPLKLAWAITVHKSQGLTFERAIMDVSRAFVSGQAYVALSRLTSLEGLVLLNPLPEHSIANDEQLAAYQANKDQPAVLQEKLNTGTRIYLQSYLLDAFDWFELVNKWYTHERELNDVGSKSVKASDKDWAKTQVKRLQTGVDAANKFRKELKTIFNQDTLSYEHLSDRINAAYQYFFDILDQIVTDTLRKLAELEIKRNTKHYAMDLVALDDWNTETVLKLKRARILCEAVRDGRELSRETIISTEILNYKVAKIAKIKDELRRNPISLLPEESALENTLSKSRKATKKKGSTYEISLELFRSGKGIKEIAKERQLSPSTINGHMVKLILQEKIELNELLSAERIKELNNLFVRMENQGSIAELMQASEGNFTYDELRLYQASLIV